MKAACALVRPWWMSIAVARSQRKVTVASSAGPTDRARGSVGDPDVPGDPRRGVLDGLLEHEADALAGGREADIASQGAIGGLEPGG